MNYNKNIIIFLTISLLVSNSLAMFEFLKFCSKNDENTMRPMDKKNLTKMKKNALKSKQKGRRNDSISSIQNEMGHLVPESRKGADDYYKANSIMNKMASRQDDDYQLMPNYQKNQNIFEQSHNMANKYSPKQSQIMNLGSQVDRKRPTNLKDAMHKTNGQRSDVLLETDISPIKNNMGMSRKNKENPAMVSNNVVDNKTFAEAMLMKNQQKTRGQRQMDKINEKTKSKKQEILNNTIVLDDESQMNFDEMSVLFGFEEGNESETSHDLQENFLQTHQESTLLNKTMFEDFDAEETIEKLGQNESMFIGEDKNNLIPAVTDFIHKMKTDVKQEVFDLVNNQVSQANKEQNTAAIGLDRYFQNMLMKNRRQRNCVFLQEMLKAMPSQRKNWTRKIKNFFSSSKVNNLKSYRTLAIDMVLNIEVNPSEKEQLRSLVEQYRLAKGLYYSQYMVGWKAKLDIEKDEKESLEALIVKQTKVVDKKHLEFENIASQVSVNKKRLGFLVEQMLAGDIQQTMEEKAKYKKLMQTARDSKEGLPDTNFKEFGTKSTMGKMVIDFNKAISRFIKWSAIEGALTHHFLNKKKLRLTIYTIETNQILLEKVLKRINFIQNKFSEKAETMRNKLTQHIKEYVDILEAKIGSDVLYSEYSPLIFTTAKLVEQAEVSEKSYLEEKMKLEEAKFKAQKLDFTDNFDYVFPTGLIMSLQKKKREFETILKRFGEGSAFFTLNDTDKFLKLQEENQFKSFFTNEVEDLITTLDRVEKQLAIAVEIDNIEGEIDYFLGSIISKTNSVVQGKGCFSLSQISYYVFLLFKTNIIAKQTRFLEGFFDQMDEKLTKEFVIFNYMLFTSQDYVDDLLERYKNSYNKDQPILKLGERKDFFTKDYIMNYSIMINFYKDMTEFGTAEAGIVKKSSNFVKSLLNLCMTYLNGNLGKIEEKGMEKVVDFLTEVVTEAFSFLNAIPFSEDLVKGAVKTVMELLVEYLSAFFNGVSQYFSQNHSQMVKEKIEEVTKKDFYLDFDQEIEKLLKPQSEKKNASFDKGSTIAEIEKKYLDSIAATSSVFNKLQNLSTFKDKDYQTKAQKIFDQNEKVNANQPFYII